MEPKTILLLGYPDTTITHYLQSLLFNVVQLDDKFSECPPADWLVSYGYRHMLSLDVLDKFPGRAINLHTSFLPWNRGADPNLWSWIENTPKGVTIHHLDAGLDTGDIIAQRIMAMSDKFTLAESYQLLRDSIEDLFIDNWPAIYNGTAPRRQQPQGGSFHRIKDRDRALKLLTDGWQTPVHKLKGMIVSEVSCYEHQ